MMRENSRTNPKKYIFFLGLIVGMCLYLVISARAATSQGASAEDAGRVYDYASLFDDSERQNLEQQVAAAREKTHMDMVIVTTDSADGKDSQAYADDFYDQGGYGTGSKKSGVLFLIDMDNRQLQISTGGDMIRFLTDRRIESILDDVYEGASEGDYTAASESFITDVVTYYKKGIESGQYNYDSETGEISIHRSIRWFEALLAVVVAGVVAAVPCLNIMNRYAMKKEFNQAAGFNFAYRAMAAFAFTVAADELLGKHVTQRVIPRQNNNGGGSGGGSFSGRSTTHTSSGGSSHGGGGRSF